MKNAKYISEANELESILMQHSPAVHFAALHFVAPALFFSRGRTLRESVARSRSLRKGRHEPEHSSSYGSRKRERERERKVIFKK